MRDSKIILDFRGTLKYNVPRKEVYKHDNRRKKHRGRPAFSPEEKRTTQIKIRITSEELGALDRYCKDANTTRATAIWEMMHACLVHGGYLGKE